MNPLLTTLTTWFLWASLLGLGARLLVRLQDVASTFAAAWGEEHAVRWCARTVAAGKNLDAAVAHLVALNPDLAPRLVAASQELKEELHASALPSPPPDAAGRCQSNGPQRLAASPHLERHDGQPAPWPNWTMRWESRGMP